MSASSVAMGVPAATAASHSHHPAVVHKTTVRSIRGKQIATVKRHSGINFDLAMALHHPAQARRFAMRVATPGSGVYRHFLSRKQWAHR